MSYRWQPVIRLEYCVMLQGFVESETFKTCYFEKIPSLEKRANRELILPVLSGCTWMMVSSECIGVGGTGHGTPPGCCWARFRGMGTCSCAGGAGSGLEVSHGHGARLHCDLLLSAEPVMAFIHHARSWSVTLCGTQLSCLLGWLSSEMGPFQTEKTVFLCLSRHRCFHEEYTNQLLHGLFLSLGLSHGSLCVQILRPRQE